LRLVSLLIIPQIYLLTHAKVTSAICFDFCLGLRNLITNHCLPDINSEANYQLVTCIKQLGSECRERDADADITSHYSLELKTHFMRERILLYYRTHSLLYIIYSLHVHEQRTPRLCSSGRRLRHSWPEQKIKHNFEIRTTRRV
jgi:hypothetical protein